MWLIGGNFNEIVNSYETKGGGAMKNSRSKDMWDMVDHCELIDLGFKGNKFT